MKFNRKNIHNWSKINNVLAITVYPETKEEIVNILKYAKKNGKKISIMGHGCSHGDLFFYNNDNIVINTSKYNQILDFNKSKMTIKVESGASILKVNNFLFKKKLTFGSIPSNYEITIGGAVSNNVFGKDSHKSGLFNKNILEIEYVNKDFNIVTISSKDNPKNILEFIGSIGLLGIILCITIQIKELKSNLLIKKNIYYPSIDNFLESYKENKILRSDFHTIKVNQFSNNFEVFVETYSYLQNFNENHKYNDYYKFKTFYIFEKPLIIPKSFYKFIKRFILEIFSYLPMRFLWKILTFFGFYLFKKQNKKTKNIHVMDLLHNNNFSDHNILFKRNGFYSFQIMIEMNNCKDLIKKYFNLAKKYKCESYLSTIKFLPKRNDFIYDYNEHIAIEIYSPRSNFNKKQDEFIKQIIELIIFNKNQVIISKDNILNKEQLFKIFPKLKKFMDLKKVYDPKNFFYSSYYDKLK